MRAVLDSNVVVSSLFQTTGPPKIVLGAWRADEFELCMSFELLAELRDVLQRPAILKQLPVGIAEIDALLLDIESTAVFPPGVIDIEPVVAANPDDDVVIATAIANRADFIVSGDAHLLDLKSHRGVAIVSPKEFAVILRGMNSI